MDIRLVLLLLFAFFVLIPLICFFTIKNKKKLKIIFAVLFAFYCVIIGIGVFTNLHIGKTITIGSYKIEKLDKFFDWTVLTKNKIDIFHNICMFIPFGYLLCFMFNKHSITKTITIGLLASIFIEVLQLLLPIPRFAQLTDIILNTISCFIGTLIFFIITHIKKGNSFPKQQS